jgi:tetratricopeptide (TPR) repeat protein
MESKGGDEAGRRSSLKKQRRTVWLVLAFLLALVLRGPALLGRAWGNAGMVKLARALVAPNDSTFQAVVQAEAMFRDAVARAPGEHSACRGLGFALAAQGREDEAIAAWQAVEGIAWEFVWQGGQAWIAGQYQDALTWYKRAVRIEPGLGDAWYYMGLTYGRLEQWEEALTAYQRGLDLPLSEIGQSDVYYRVGWVQFRKIEASDPMTALAAFDAAIALDQFSREVGVVEAHLQRAAVLHVLDRDAEALSEYEWVIERQPEDYWAYVNAAALYWQLERDVERVESMLMAAIALRPDYDVAYLRLALLYLNLGKKAEAIEVYRQVLSFDPQNEAASEQLGKFVPLGSD